NLLIGKMLENPLVVSHVKRFADPRKFEHVCLPNGQAILGDPVRIPRLQTLDKLDIDIAGGNLVSKVGQENGRRSAAESDFQKAGIGRKMALQRPDQIPQTDGVVKKRYAFQERWPVLLASRTRRARARLETRRDGSL